MKSAEGPMMCNLPAFAGGQPESLEISHEDVNIDFGEAEKCGIPAATLLKFAWALTLHLYTGHSNPSFYVGSADGHGKSTTNTYVIRPQDTLSGFISRHGVSTIQNGVNGNKAAGDHESQQLNTVCNTIVRLGSLASQATVHFVINGEKSQNNTLPTEAQVSLDAQINNDLATKCSLLFRKSFISEDEARNLAATVAHLVHELVNNPGKRVADLQPSTRDRDQIRLWNSGQLLQTECLIHEAFTLVAAERPNDEAIDAWDGCMSFKDLEHASNVLGYQLIRQGVTPGSLVLLSFEKSLWAVVSWLAVLKAGAACVFLDRRHPVGRVRQIVEATGATHALTSSSLTIQLDDLGLNVIQVPIQPLTSNGVQNGNEHKWPTVHHEDAAFVIFTSGSTGTPKGVVLTHTGVHTTSQDIAKSLGVTADSRVLQFSSYTFDMSIADMVTSLLSGACICIPSEADRLDSLQAYLQETSITWAMLTPTVARLLDARVTANLKTLVLVGEVVKESDIRPWIDAGVQVHNGYGPAEATFLATSTGKVGTRLGRASCIGRGMNTRTWIIDPVNDQLAPIGAVGELVVESPVLAIGYLNDPRKTAESFVSNPNWAQLETHDTARRRFYKTGDLARYFADGSLECIGRADTQVKLGGQRVELTDIEHHLRKNNATANSAVFLPQRGPFSGRLTAVMASSSQAATLKNGHTPIFRPCGGDIIADAKSALLQAIATYMVPSVWLEVGSLPFTATGKLDRRLLLEKLEAMSSQDAMDYVSEETDADATESDEVASLLWRLCSNTLNVPVKRINHNRSFLAHGGDSITAMQIVSSLRREHKTLRVKDLLSSSTLREAASRIGDLHAYQPLPSISIGKRFPISPIQQFFFNIAQSRQTRNHFHQSVFLRLRERQDVIAVESAISDLVERHPMLRARFEQSSSGEWTQFITDAVNSSYVFEYHERTTAKTRKTTMLKSRLALSAEDGPLVRVSMFDEGGVQYLFLVVHHLVVDLVSWRIILEELESLLVEVHPKFPSSFPFLAWVDQQRNVVRTIKPARVLPQTVPASDFGFWGIEKQHNVYADVQEERFSISSALTNDVLVTCHQALRTEPIDILISALLLSFRGSFPQRSLPAIFTEAHGREAWDEQIDLSRTIGWFTTMYPIYASDYKDIVDLVMRVKDARKRTPNRGFDYFSTAFLTMEGREAFRDHLPAEVLFNYEGRYQSLEKDNSLLRQESWTAGEALEDNSPELQRFSLFEIAASVLDGCLHFTFAWNYKSNHQSMIKSWSKDISRAIERITTTLQSSSRSLTLSDLSHSDLNYSGLDSLATKIRKIPGVRGLEDVEDAYPCSPLQESLALSQSRLEGVYEVDIQWEVTTASGASVDPSRLEDAWHDVVSRHAAFRTIFLETSASSGMLDQVVLKRELGYCEQLLARNASDAMERLAHYPPKPKGLGSGQPLHRLLICSTEDERTFVRFEVNHIVFDGMSLLPMLRDLSLAYDGKLVTKWGSPYASFIRYIRDQGLREKSISYWKQYLTGAEACVFPSLLDVTNGESEQKVAPVSLNISHTDLHTKLSELEVTLPVLIQLTWSLVLRLYTNGNQTVTGYLASGRDAPVAGIEGAIGPFISMLLCYIDFSQPRTLLDLLREVKQDSINGAAHQASSLAEIQNAIGITGGTLFNAGISFMPLLDKRAQQGSSLLFEEKSINDPTEFELALIVESGEDATQVSVHYRTSFVSEGHATNIAAAVNHILMEILNDPSRTPDEIPALSSHDLRQLWSWNETCIEAVEECVHHFVERTMHAHPDKEAIFSWDGSLSYKELDDLSRNMAHHLKNLGIGPEKIVPLCFEKSKWAVVSMLAVLRAGACFVMLDPTHPNPRVLAIADEVEAEVLLCSPLTASKFEEIEEKTIVVEPGFACGLPFTNPNEPVCSTVTPDNAMYVVFTSGTTGAPKGSITSHRAYCTGFREHAWAIEVGPESRTLQFSAYSFDASVGDILTTLLVGGCICIPSEEDRSMEIANFISKSRATWAGWTPSFASLVDPDTVPTLTVLLMAGEPLPASQVDAWVDRLKLLNIYGPSECSVACVVNKDVTRETNASNIGRGYRCVTWVVDENDHERLRPIGSAGELLIEGPILARGYLKRPEKTSEVFIDAPSWLRNGPHPRTNRLYKTGDLVRYNSDGTINFIGRKDTQLKINGQRVEIGEIEHSLRSSIPPTAGPVVVDLLKRTGAGEQDLLAAFVHVGAEDTSPEDPDDIIATEAQALEKFHGLVKQIYETTSSLPRYMSPHVFIPLKVLPITTAGKLDRRALQRVTSRLTRDELVSFTSGAKETGRTSQERQLTEMWKKVLHVSSIGIHDNFFRLGGDSMAAMALRSEAQRNGMGISVSDIFSNPVLVDMAKVMASVNDTADLAPVASFSLLEDYDSVSQLISEVAHDCSISPDAIEDILPCVPMQEALMALSSRQPSAQTYVLHAPYKLPADIDELRFREAWEKATETHAVLRGRIVLKPQGALLAIVKDKIHVDTYSRSLEEYLSKQKQQAFGYGTPLLRLGLVKQGSDRYFVFNAHHAVYDGWSTKLIWDTVLQHYRGETIASAPQFQALVQMLKATPREPSVDYWKQAMIDRQGVAFPSVPVSHKPVARCSTRFEFSIPAASNSDRDVTTATLINAAWAIVNAQYSADSTATYGCTLFGRDFPLSGIEQLVGPTIVTVPRQFAVRGDQSLAEFLDYVQKVTIDSIPHQYLGLSEIQSVSLAAQEAYDFTSLMVVHPDAALKLPFEEVDIKPVPLDNTESHTYPLAVEFLPVGEQLTIDVRFDPDCIGLEMVNIVMGHFNHVLQSICHANATADVASVMGIRQKDLSLIHSWNSSSIKPVEACVHNLIERKATEQPDSPAVVSHDASLSYSTLDQWANQLASQIVSTQLVKPGDFVGLCLDKSARAIPAMIAVLKAGGAFLPLNPDHPPARLQALLEEANTELVLASPSRASSLTSALGCKVLSVNDFNASQLFQAPSGIAVTPEHPAYLLFTSGSTGKPKGVVIDHQAWASAIAAQSAYFDFGPQIRMLQFSSYTFDAMIFEIFITLTSGGCVCAPSESERMNDLSGYITRERVNALISTPSVTRLIVPAKVPTLKLVMVGGEPLAPSDIEAWLSQPGVSFVNAYGPTEACVMATARKVAMTDSSSNIGVPVGTATWVINPFTQALAPIGAVGELCIEGPTLSRGYLGDPEKTNISFEKDPICLPKGAGRRIYHTGDLVRHNADGSLTFVGRRDGQVKLRGQRIEVGEIEENIRKFMASNDSFKHIGVELSDASDGRTQPFLAALLVMDIGYDHKVNGIGCASMLDPSNQALFDTASHLQKQLRNALPEYMVPSAYVAVEQLPTTASSKRDRVFVRACLSELSAKGQLFPVSAKSGEKIELFGNERLLQGWWAKVLSIDPESISASDHFFALGGNSITAIRLAGLARSSKYRLMFEDIFSFPVLSEMASRTAADTRRVVEMPQAFELLPADQYESVINNVLPLYGIRKDEVEDIYPCTPLQEGLMAVTARNPGAYISADTMDITETELPKLREAWAAAFEKFELLRTRIILSHEYGSLQVVLQQQPVWHETDNVESFLDLVQNLHGYGKPMIHLAVVPTSRAGIVRVVFSSHHSVYDGWSLGLVRQFLEDHVLRDPAGSDAFKTVPFKSFIRHLVDQDPEEARSYWSQRMAGLQAPPFPRPPHNSKHQPLATAFLEQGITLPEARGHGSVATIATIIRAAWSLTISHYTASPDTIFGAIVTGRESADVPDIELIAGPTIATVPTRTKIDYDLPIGDFLRSVQRDAVTESRFCQLGLSGIARINKECHQSCEFGSILVVQPPVNSGVGKVPQLRQGSVASSKFFPQALVLDCQTSEDNDAVTVTLSYDPIIMGDSHARFVLSTFSTLLCNLVAAPPTDLLRDMASLSDSHVSELASITGQKDLNVIDFCTHELFGQQVNARPGNPAIDSWDGPMSYLELDCASSILAHQLQKLGVGPEKAAPFMFDNSKWAIVSMLAIWKAGGYFVPLDPKSPNQRLQHLIQATDAGTILTSSQYRDRCLNLKCDVVLVNEDTFSVGSSTSLAVLQPTAKTRDTAYVLFTSGTTGIPKGVVIEHRTLASSITALGKYMGMDVNSRVLRFCAFTFDAMLLDTFATLINGGCVCVPSEDQKMNDLVGFVQEFQVNTTWFTTSLSRIIDPASVPTLKTVAMGGEAVLQSDIDRWAPKVRLVSGYGPTETCIITLMGELTPSTPPNNVGWPVVCRAWVVNPLKSSELAPIGGVGELFIEGPCVARGYLRNDEATKAAFLENPAWLPEGASSRRVYRTGDFVYYNPDGTLSFFARKDSQVKIRGQRVELSEIEEAIRQHVPSWMTTAVDVFKPGGQDQQILAAVFGVGAQFPELHQINDTNPSAQLIAFMKKLSKSLRTHLAETLPGHMIPDAYLPLPQLPVQTSGKLDRRVLQTLVNSMTFKLIATYANEDNARRTPQTNEECTLAHLWSKSLNIIDETSISTSDNFFSLGGDSILAMRLVALVRSEGYSLAVAQIFSNPTLSGMASKLQKLDDGRQQRETTVQSSPATSPVDDALRAKIATNHNFTLSRVEDVFACTPIQEAFMDDTVQEPGAQVVQFIFALDDTIKLSQLRGAIDRCAHEFPILRTRIVRDSNQLFQVVLSDKMPWKEFLSASLESVLKDDKLISTGIGTALARVSIVHNIEKRRLHLIWTLHHSLYDAWSLRLLLDAVNKAYQDRTWQPVSELPFKSLAESIRGRDANTDRTFWASYLAGAGNSPLFGYLFVRDPIKDMRADFQVPLPQKTERTTLTAKIASAWIRLVGRLTESSDVTIGWLVTGRAAAIPGIQNCVGPAISKVPLRVRLGSGDNTADVSEKVQSELTRLMPFELSGLKTVRNASQDASDACRFPLDLTVHPHGTLSFAGEGIGMRFVGGEVAAAPPGGLAVECTIKDSGIEVAIFWDKRAARKEKIEDFLENFKTVLLGD
ncbi:peptide synthetase [Colletotrichum karsti]|uniref:Peptide synthetase n=1 Tax=Colletotrichum karsti TaxID=1095194 RepID=A0A9P6HY48_9PEZI|nr:peptide synthetase [Colletotrichum karsti]KAF9873683.1 peptide synthetase [Colletotrichum karsti]